MLRSALLTLPAILASALLSGPLVAQQAPAPEGDSQRQIFDAEICVVDGLTPGQCQCAWDYVRQKMSPADLRLAMLLTASNSEDDARARRADQQLKKSTASDNRQDAISSEIAALTIEAEDACEGR